MTWGWGYNFDGAGFVDPLTGVVVESMRVCCGRGSRPGIGLVKNQTSLTTKIAVNNTLRTRAQRFMVYRRTRGRPRPFFRALARGCLSRLSTIRDLRFRDPPPRVHGLPRPVECGRRYVLKNFFKGFYDAGKLQRSGNGRRFTVMLPTGWLCTLKTLFPMKLFV